jgi:hypothetical protein
VDGGGELENCGFLEPQITQITQILLMNFPLPQAAKPNL